MNPIPLGRPQVGYQKEWDRALEVWEDELKDARRNLVFGHVFTFELLKDVAQTTVANGVSCPGNYNSARH